MPFLGFLLVCAVVVLDSIHVSQLIALERLGVFAYYCLFAIAGAWAMVVTFCKWRYWYFWLANVVLGASFLVYTSDAGWWALGSLLTLSVGYLIVKEIPFPPTKKVISRALMSRCEFHPSLPYWRKVGPCPNCNRNDFEYLRLVEVKNEVGVALKQPRLFKNFLRCKCCLALLVVEYDLRVYGD